METTHPTTATRSWARGLRPRAWMHYWPVRGWLAGWPRFELRWTPPTSRARKRQGDQPPGPGQGPHRPGGAALPETRPDRPELAELAEHTFTGLDGTRVPERVYEGEEIVILGVLMKSEQFCSDFIRRSGAPPLPEGRRTVTQPVLNCAHGSTG
jgi:hypothetical protein